MITNKRLKEILKPKAYKDLMKYMKGQTIKPNPDGFKIYDLDFIRWILELEVID